MSVKSLLTDEQQKFVYDEYHRFLINAQVSTEKYHMYDFFEVLRQKNPAFKKFSDKELSNKIIASRRLDGAEEWPNLSEIEDYINPQARSLIEKSHNSALLAIEIYNKPLISYRTEGFIVMMMISWTALFHAVFQKKGIAIKYKDGDEESYLDLRKCIKKYEGKLKKEITANLTLLVEIRDKIVHRENAELDDRLFGFCQSCLINLEELLVENFGDKYQLPNSLAFSLQFSKKYQPQQMEAIKKYNNKNNYKILDFIKEYEDKLFKTDVDVYKSQSYCFRIYMIPKIVKENKAEAAIEYIKYETLEPDSIEKLDKAILLIKETRVGGDFFKAGAVSKIVYDKLKAEKGDNWKFSAAYHHSQCLKYFKIREGYKTNTPDNTKKEYCFYDATFDQYIYTQQWINFLVGKLKDDKLYSQILKTK